MNNDVRCPHCGTYLDRPDMVEVLSEHIVAGGMKTIKYLCGVCSKEFNIVRLIDKSER